MSTIPLTLPDGTVLQYHGDPSLVPEITQNGIPVPLAPARPNQFPNGLPSLGGWLSDQNPLSQGLKNFGNTVQSTAKSLTLGGASFGVIDIVAIIAGLLLLGGAVFGLESVRDTTINVAKKGAEVAAL